ncbi:hypothetical protein GCM10027343_38660 [Noviherbaspirillum agri]
MFETLYGKTFSILVSQLGITWLSTVMLIGWLRRHYHARSAWVSGGVNEHGQLDLDLDWNAVQPYFWSLIVADFAVFLFLIFYGENNLGVGFPLFCIWSVLTGLMLALALVSVDENLGARVLALTALVTAGAGLYGVNTSTDFSFMRSGLFLALSLLIVFGFIRIFFQIPRWVQRIGAFCGVLVFTAYLVYDFNKLSALSRKDSANTWTAAMDISISLYLDIINLFLDLLDLLSK